MSPVEFEAAVAGLAKISRGEASSLLVHRQPGGNIIVIAQSATPAGTRKRARADSLGHDGTLRPDERPTPDAETWLRAQLHRLDGGAA